MNWLNIEWWQNLFVEGSWWWFFIGCFLGSTLLPLASEALLLGFLFYIPANQVGWAVLVATLGNTLGGLSTWMIGYYLPHPPNTLRWQKPLQRWGAPLTSLAWLPIIGDGINLAAGWLQIPWTSVLIYNALGRGARYGAVVYLSQWIMPEVRL